MRTKGPRCPAYKRLARAICSGFTANMRSLEGLTKCSTNFFALMCTQNMEITWSCMEHIWAASWVKGQSQHFFQNWDFDAIWMVLLWKTLSINFTDVSFLFLRRYATFLFHANQSLHIDMHRFDRPSRKMISMLMSLVSLFLWHWSCKWKIWKSHEAYKYCPHLSQCLWIIARSKACQMPSQVH